MQVDNTTHRILPEISFSQLTYQPLSHLPTSSLFSPGNTSLITSTLISQSFCGMPTQKLFHTWSCFKYVTIHSISSFVYTLLDSFGINRLGQVCPFSSCQGTCHRNSLLSLLVLRLLPNFRPNSFWWFDSQRPLPSFVFGAKEGRGFVKRAQRPGNLCPLSLVQEGWVRWRQYFCSLSLDWN